VPLERKLVSELLLDDVADHPFRLCAEHVQRIGVDRRVCGSLKREQPDLRPVAVRDDELVLDCDGS
jgi:hypothetical protein